MRAWLIQLRESKNLTQQQVADASGINRAYYTHIENGTRGEKLPVDTAKKIAKVLDFPYTRFYDEESAS